jgi:hypothetical protein
MISRVPYTMANGLELSMVIADNSYSVLRLVYISSDSVSSSQVEVRYITIYLGRYLSNVTPFVRFCPRLAR